MKLENYDKVPPLVEQIRRAKHRLMNFEIPMKLILKTDSFNVAVISVDSDSEHPLKNIAQKFVIEARLHYEAELTRLLAELEQL